MLSSVLGSLGVKVRTVEMPKGTQHLLGVCNFVDKDLAVVHSKKASRELLAFLGEIGVMPLFLEPGDELDRGRAMNFVTLGPRRVVMPSACPATRERYERAGIEVFELDLSEYLKAAGGLACLTGILRRA